MKNLTEHFDYDGLNRLWKVSHNSTLKQETLYDAAGNLTYKTGVGTTFKYEDKTNKLISVSGAGYNPPAWDDIKYSSFNKIISVQQGNNALGLVYGVNKERKKSVTTKNGVTQTKYYAGNLYEEEYIIHLTLGGLFPPFSRGLFYRFSTNQRYAKYCELVNRKLIQYRKITERSFVCRIRSKPFTVRGKSVI